MSMGDDEVPRRIARARRVESLTVEPNWPRPSATPIAVAAAAAGASGISIDPFANDYYYGEPGHWEFIGASGIAGGMAHGPR